ncbi:hypothetical protein [Pseudobacteriovorax antillogorgiicola]|uniref:Uncharacterized protein n=1 Tax=Pseudobacteriovorax antillogorgiicola TaxID=1513793 RepID=A0A1Y6BFN9_9BACT|nr:hypothetical protein [Pseudobacteriovorax antillogorgiicola]TCS56212.1 hypothetical protein EDD56_10434 [Pseudobacteriovorax antillogorgiicola]SMF08488.1 hypothetical protein SAMN06296036_104300 [Pseudobacteriovorax antillogorgiicola]
MNYIVLTVLALLFLACESERNFISENTEQRSNASGATPDFEISERIKLIADASYDLTLSDQDGGNYCTGKVRLQILSNIDLNFETSQLDCLGLSFDFSRILNSDLLGSSLSTEEDTDGNLLEGLSHDGDMLYIGQAGSVSYNPPRPVLLGPLIVKAEKYAGYYNQIESTMEWTDELENIQSSRGVFEVEVNQADFSFDTPQEALPHVINWQITSTGFSPEAVLEGIIFQKIEWWWSTSPLMIPQISITTNPLVFLGEDAEGISNLVGDLTLTLSVEDFSFPSD